MKIETVLHVSNQEQPTLPPPLPVPVPQTLYSNEWTLDHKPRQTSFEFEREGLKDYGASVGLPDYYRVYADPWVILTRERQDWLFRANCLSAYGTVPNSGTALYREAVIDWGKLMKHGVCFTNKAGWNSPYNRADYVQGLNLTAKPMEWEVLLLGGNRVDVLESGVTRSERYTGVQGAYQHYRIRAINARKLPTVEQFLADPAVCHRCTTIQRDGTHGVFPQFRERAIYPVWMDGADTVLVWERLIKV